MAETGGNCPALKNEEKLHGRENPKLACIIHGGQNLIAPERPAGRTDRARKYLRKMNIYCIGSWIYTATANEYILHRPVQYISLKKEVYKQQK